MSFSVYGATNLAAPISWTFLGHPTETPSGGFSSYQFIDSQATNKPHEFYRVTSP